MIDRTSRGLSRAAQLVVVAVVVAIGVNHVAFAIRDWPLGDMDVYLAAAQRLRDGDPLYVAGDVAVNSFWYAPWYAVLWVPLTFLPREVVAVVWSAILLGASAAVSASLWAMGRRGAVLALLVGPALFAVSAGGNVQALMLLALLQGVNRPWGPVAVAGAASLKFAPILLVVAYVARGEWRRALVTVGLAAVLLVPAAAMGITDVGVRSEAAPSLLGVSPVLYGVAVSAAVAVTLLGRRQHAVLGAATAAVLALPRLFVYDITLVAAGAAKPGSSNASRAQRVPRGKA